MIPVVDAHQQESIEAVKNLILNEVNVKELKFVDNTAGILVKKIKPDFKKLGPRYGKIMKALAATIQSMSQEDINAFEKAGTFTLMVDGQEAVLERTDVEIISEDIPGWLVANEGRLTVALDITVTEDLRKEGLARELVNRIQNLRKSSGFDITDKIHVSILLARRWMRRSMIIRIISLTKYWRNLSKSWIMRSATLRNSISRTLNCP